MLKIKLLWFWTKVSITNYKTGKLDDKIFIFPKEKYKDFSSYTNKMSNLSTWYLTIICAIPYLYVAIKTTNNVDGFWSFLGWGCLVFGLLIGWFIACILSFYTGYAYKDNFLIKLFCPIVTVPLSWILLMIGANILALISSCSLLGFLDPRFL